MPTIHRVENPRPVALRNFTQKDGTIVPIELTRDLPFKGKRIFYIYGVPEGEFRGDHAHKKCHQFVIPIHGHFEAHIENPNGGFTFLLGDKKAGLHVPPLNWLRIERFSKDAVCLVIASEPYQVEDYLNDYEAYKKAVGK